ncbi:amidohydrolase family protein [Cryobacterium psychrophilum]|uniref:Amidohydrolase n=1 Tax=Cryobacterium psychrophilum TaxID=41988 RepID=A0A4Y8KIL1_9MICO|nr:amidohydrolase [Cryobacterium psychrophilum]TDW30033.1 hypothetical protein EDD25_1767 [Cryobacterium psychrophilum]TFD75521.1 amidohydrolase [Cryobacterium psychrophilum]
MTVLPPFLDAHVHLALIDPAPLLSHGIARVLDLGGYGGGATGPSAPAPELPDTALAGQFLTAPGGYPARTVWAPAGSVCEVTTVTDAAAAVDVQEAGGASVIKVTLNSVAGAVLASEILDAIVARAHRLGLPVVAHAEGTGEAERAFVAGVDMLAHTPFSERIDDELVAAMAGRMTWISTLDIHGHGHRTASFDLASDNLARFHDAGGRMLYGTDLGNGPLPVGLNRQEIEALLRAGLSPDDVIGALTNDAGLRWPTGATERVTVIAGERPSDPADFAAWLCTARAVNRSSHHSEAHDADDQKDPHDLAV